MGVVATRQRPVRAVVIDDTSDIRDLMSMVLTRSGMEVVGEAGDGRAGVDVVRAERPDVVLLDLAMPVMDGMEALPLIRELVPAIVQQQGTGEVLMLGWMDDEALARTLTTGRATYWSRSRQEYWVKGCLLYTSDAADE